MKMNLSFLNFSALFLLITSIHAQTTHMKAKILYIYDPLCGWCYGFTPVMQQLSQEFANDFEFDVISGGMVVGGNEGPITNIAPYISEAFKNVEAASGIKFGEEFLKNRLWDPNYRMSSVKPSIALEVFKSFNPSKSVDFAHDIQHAFYFDGKSLESDETYLELIKRYEIDANLFLAGLENEEFKRKTFEEFKKSATLGVNGFPTVVFIRWDKSVVLSRGYTTKSELAKLLTKYK